ncbi:putative ATP-dependent DNA ligase [Natronospira proteinivora]|uniref:ATP-dependent DNA ligase n=1 Tax=Natronospira proteinivora TaxID=1807133 RepID=A0ABT1GA31_9GAMM|nr:putative ATP-dependent DNA ligase [Natronospira proteinivora]
MSLLEAKSLETALERGKAQRLTFDHLSYTHLRDDVGQVPKGSVILDDGTVIPGYPSIARIQALDPGIGKQFEGPFWAEEKMDGFNVRIFQHEGQCYALSRGGFICPFATDRLNDLLKPAIFDDYPHLILCAEIVGPGNPYLEGHSPQVQEDVDLFVFDMMVCNEEGFLPQAERMALVEDYGLQPAEIFGRYQPEELNELAELILQLDEEGKEGLVLKPENQKQRAKYVTGRSNIYDISVTGEALLDLPPEYFTNRFLRMGLFMAEHGQQHDHDRLNELGHAMMQGLFRAVQESQKNGRVSNHYRCRFNHRDNADRFMEHIELTGGQRVKVHRGMPRQEGDYWVLEFERIHQRMTGKINQALQGGRQFD